jgi:hypothetical protein
MINRIEPKDFDSPFSLVKNVNNNTSFILSAREIKHIRRCLYSRELNNPSLDSDTNHLTKKILIKFTSLGELKLIRRKEVLLNSNVIQKCSFMGCKETINLEVHHKNPVSNGGRNNINNLKFYCSLHHDYIELNNVLKRKEQEIIITKKRIIEIEKKLEAKNNVSSNS